MSEKNQLARLETFCDGVFAIAATLLILEIKIPPIDSVHSVSDLSQMLWEDWPSWFGFCLSFIIIAIAWVNHHVGLQHIIRSSSLFIYANLFLVLIVAVLPFVTGLMAEYLQTPYAQPAVSIYCFVLLIHNIAWVLLMRSIFYPVPLTGDEAGHNMLLKTKKNSEFAFFIYAGIFIFSFWFPVTAMVLITASWVMWIITGITMHPKNR